MTIREAPRIETQRLVLRQWRKDDFRPYHAIISHPEVHKHYGPEPMGAEDCWRRISSVAGNWLLNGFGGWAVEQKADRKLVGNVALFTAWRDLEPEFGDDPEMGWMFAAETHGKGMASEAARAALGWAEANLPPTPIWAIISPGNEPSIRLAERIGFEKFGESLYRGDPTIVFKRPAWG
jgi:RimJ/RimL family protein N-acetyltransferase